MEVKTLGPVLKNKVKTAIKDILSDIYINDDDFPYSCDLATKLLLRHMKDNLNIRRDYEVYYARGHYKIEGVLIHHSFLKIYKDKKLNFIIDPTSYQFSGMDFYQWEMDYYRMNKEEVLSSLNKLNKIFIHDNLDDYVSEVEIKVM